MDSKEGSDYIANFDLVPPSPTRSLHDLPDYLYANPDIAHPLNPNNPHTPSYNGSFYNSPYSQHSELSFSAEDINFDLLSEIAGMDNNTYEPSEYDGPSPATGGGLNSSGNPTNSLLMFTQDSDYMSPHFSPDAVGNSTSRRGSPFDHSTPSSNGDPNDMGSALMGAGAGYGNDAGRHSRASSVASNHRSPVHSPSPQPNLGNNNNSFQPQPLPSPRMDVAQSFGNMSVHTPNWGTQALPTHSPNMRTHSPLPPPNKAMSPPRLLMPDSVFDGSSSVLGLDIQGQQQQQDNLLTAVPKINAPDGGAAGSNNADDDMNGGGGGPSFHIVPATPIAGGVGDGHQNAPFQTLTTINQGAELGSPDLGSQQQQRQSNQLNVHSQPPSRQPSPYTPPSRLSPAPPNQNQNQNASGLGTGSSTSSTGGFVFPDLNQMQQQVSQQHQQQQGQDDQVRGRRGSDTWASFDYQQQQQIVQQQQQQHVQQHQQQQRQQMHHAQMQAFSFGGAGSSSTGGNSNGNNNNNAGGNNQFLSPDLMRRSISDSLGAPGMGRGHRLSRSEDIRLPLPGVGGFASNNNSNPTLGPGGYQPHHGQSTSLSVGGGNTFSDFHSQQQPSGQFLHPLHFPPSSANTSPLPPIRRSLSPGIPFPNNPPGVGVNVGHFRRASSGTRSDRGAEVWGSQGVGVGVGHGHGHLGGVARRVSPYPSPNASPRVRYEELQDDGVQPGLQGGLQQDDGLLGVDGGMSQGGGGLGFGGLGLGLGGGGGLSGLSGPGLSLGGPGSGLGGGGAGQAMGLGHPGLGEIGEPPVSGGFSEEIPITGRGTYANHPSLVNDGASSQGGRRRAGSANSAENGNALSLSNNPIAKQNVTTGRTANASIRRRKQDANFACTVPGCNSTFTRGFNLKGHLRSHYEQKPYKCHWPGCGKGFARQHDCKRHEQLHSNFRPFECEGCKKQFARMDALNRHLRSEAGGECMRAMAERGVSAGVSQGGRGGGGGLQQDVGMDDDDDDAAYGEEMKGGNGFVPSPSPPQQQQQQVVTTRSGRQVPRRRMTGQMDEDAWASVAL